MTEKEKQKISQNESENNVYKAQLDKYFNNQMPSHEIINVCSTPNILKVFNSAARKVVLYQSVLENAVSAADFKNQKHSEGHDIAKLEIYKLPESIRSPILMLKGNGRNSNSIVMLTEMINKKGENVFVPIALDRNKGKISNISTLYGKKNLSKYLSDHLADIMAINIKKADMLANIGVRFPKSIYDTVVCFDDSIAYTTANVKNLSEKVQTLFSEKVKFPGGESKERNNNMAELTQEALLEKIAALEKQVAAITAEQQTLKEQMNTVNQFISSITESQNFEQSMATIESMGRQVLDCREAEFWCYDSAENKYFSNSEERGGREWKIAEENMRIAAGNKQIHISDGAAYIPIISNDRVSGVLIASGKDGGFNQKDLEKFAPNSQIANTVDLALKKEFEHQGRITDELTRLKNRQGAKEYAANTMAHNINNKKDMCIIMCDIDHFKSVNDTYGHDAGDTVLKNVAAILQSGTRQGADSAFRWGGEEMVCVLNCDYDHAMDIAERLRAQIENATHLVYDGNRQPANIGVTISMGVHHIKADMEITPQNAFDFFESQLKFADELAYQAKESGRNMVVGGESTIVSEKEKYSLFTVEINGEIMNYRDNNASDIDALMNRYASCGGYLPDFTENCTRITNLEFAEMEQSDTSKPVFCAEINVDNNTLTVWDNEKIADSSLDNAVENIEENGALNLSYRPFAQPDDFEHYTDVTSEKTISDVINKDSDNITVEGHTGTWYVIDTAEVDGQELFLLENEEYGDETANVIVDENGALVMDDVWNGFDELYEQMDDMAESEEKVYDLEDDVIGEDGFLDKCDDMEQWAKEVIEKADDLEKGINGKEI